MRDYFHLREKQTNAITEIVAGVTTFFAVSYTLTVTPAILGATGMPIAGVFVASVAASAAATFAIALFANAPLVAAPGMGLNAFFANTLCLGMGFHWKEALAVVLMASLIHIAVMLTKTRRLVMAAIPESLRYATTVGVGLFISFIGMKNAGLLTFTVAPGAYTITDNGTVLADSSAYPGLIGLFNISHLVTLAGLAVTLYLIGLEKRTGDKYAPFLLGIVAATFIGIPLGITDIPEHRFIDYGALGDVRHVFLAFAGNPGLLSLVSDPAKMSAAVAMCLVLALTDIVNSFSCIPGVGRLTLNPVFDETEINPGHSAPVTRLDRCLMANSFSGLLSAVAGTSTSTVYIESVTGIAAGGRTGLTSLVTGLMFLLCLPLAGLFSIIPGAALAPAMIIAGLYLMSLVSRIDWKNSEDAVPAAMTILFIAITFSVLSGVMAGCICHLVLKIACGKSRELKPAFLLVTLALTLVTLTQNIMELFK